MPAPGNIGELTTHFSYLRRDVDEIKNAVKDLKNGYVTRLDFDEHLKADDDHEKRIRTIESLVQDVATVKKIVYSCVALILAAFVGAVIYIVIPNH